MPLDDPLDRFLAVLEQTPIPEAPPPRDRYLEALGLNLLSVALRLDHVDRMSEALSLIDATHMSRSISLDINLNALTLAERHALRSDPDHTGSPPTAIWLPVARQARADLAPIVVTARRGRPEPDVRTLRGWRRELVGAELLDLLAGRRRLRVGEGGRISVDER